MPECDRQKGAHEEFTRALPDPKYGVEWTQMVTAWEQDKSKPNPYCTEKLGEYSTLLLELHVAHRPS
jgi:hypothetical protein